MKAKNNNNHNMKDFMICYPLAPFPLIFVSPVCVCWERGCLLVLGVHWVELDLYNIKCTNTKIHILNISISFLLVIC